MEAKCEHLAIKEAKERELLIELPKRIEKKRKYLNDLNSYYDSLNLDSCPTIKKTIVQAGYKEVRKRTEQSIRELRVKLNKLKERYNISNE